MYGKNPVTKQHLREDGQLAVHSVWPTIQGEGPDSGKPAVFVRLQGCNLRCWFCFVPSTPILMDDGSYRRIDQVKVGDMVMSWHRDHFEPRRVTKTYKSITDRLIKVKVPNRYVWCTPEHPFLTSQRGWVNAEDLRPGDALVHWDVHNRMTLLNPALRGPRDENDPRRESSRQHMAALWRDPSFRRSQIKRMRSNDNPMKDPEVAARAWQSREDGGKTKLEERFEEICNGLPIYYCGDGRTFSIAHKFPDFKVRGQDKVIELWASDALWSRDRGPSWIADRRRLFEKHGYQTLFLPLEYRDVKVANRPKLRERVARFINNGAIVQAVEEVTDPKAWARLYGTTTAPRWVYNLEVEGSHTYVANSLVVHNCDTDFDAGELRPANEIAAQVADLSLHHRNDLVVITGGEPLIQNIIPFVDQCNEMSMSVSIETAGTVWVPGVETRFHEDNPHHNLIVCSPKTTLVNKELVPYVGAWKYIVREGEVGHDGLPVCSTQINEGLRTPLYRPHVGHHAPIYVQPMDENLNGLEYHDSTPANVKLARDLCMKYGYRLSLQIHKIVGVP